MLFDWLHYLVTPAAADFRRLGFVRDSIWLFSRSRRCRRAWRSHIARSRAVMMEALVGLDRRRTVVVLGSGLLDDVPMGDLARAFEAVVLVDVVHPWPTRLAIRRHRNVRLLSFDLSGCADWMLGRRTDLGPVLPQVCLAPDVDLVISANVLSQLPVLPLDWFGDRVGVPSGLGNRIVSAHLDALAALTCRTCLVTDTVQVEEDRAGHTIEASDLLHGVGLGMPDEEWDWELAPFGEAGRGTRHIHHVCGFRDWKSGG